MVRSTKTVLLAILFRALFNANIQAFRQAIFPWCHVKRPQGGVLADLLNVPRDGSLWARIPSPLVTHLPLPRADLLNVLIVAYGRPSWALSGTALVVDIL